MGEQLFFEIPDDVEVMVKLLEAVPSEWSWVDGVLHVPGSVRVAEVAMDTGFAVDRFNSIHRMIVERYDRGTGRRSDPDLYAVMVERKLPQFVSFNEAGYDSGFITLDLAKRIAVGFLMQGYRGDLRFYKGCHDYNKYENAARCGLIFTPWEGASHFGMNEEAGPQPPRVKFEWNDKYYGNRKDIESILAVCRDYNLREYIPNAPAKCA